MSVEAVQSVRRITRELLVDVPGTRHAVVVAADPGVVAGLLLLDPDAAADSAGRWCVVATDGDVVGAGRVLVEIEGSAWELAVAEDHVLGVIGAASGIARQALDLCAAAPPDLRISCGGWKKLPVAMKPVLRAGLDVAGVSHRLIDGEFVYIDKNVAALRGGIAEVVRAGIGLDHGPVAVQVRTVNEALDAVAAGCGIVMVDTGSIGDLRSVDEALRQDGTRSLVQLAFGGGVSSGDLVAAREAGADIVDVGRAIIDAPLWDVRMTVIA